MAELLTGIGEISYGGWTFGPKTTSSIDVVYEPNDAGSTIRFARINLNVKTLVATNLSPFSGTALETKMVTMREALSEAGKNLVYSGFGFEINNTTSNDVDFGPFPQRLTCRSVGGNANEVEWSVQARLSECATGASNGLMERSLSMSYAIDEDGYLTYTANGHLRIAARRNGATSPMLTETADDTRYRELWHFAPPDGFKRKSQTRTLERHGSILRFNIVDEEMPAPLQEGVSRCRARHRVTLSNFFSTASEHEITATYAMARGVPKSEAYIRFMMLVASRFPNFTETSAGPNMLYHSFSAEDDIFGRERSFTIRLRKMDTPFKDLLALSGFDSEIKGTSYSIWNASLKNQTSALGVTGITFKVSDDKIIDLCGARQASATPPAGKIVPVRKKKITMEMKQQFTAAGSWVDWHGDCWIEADSGAVQHILLTQSASMTEIQKRYPGDYAVCHFSGWALRAGFQIPKPVLADFNGFAYTPGEGDRFIHSIAWEGCGGATVYQAEWHLVFLIYQKDYTSFSDILEKVRPPQNPITLQDVDLKLVNAVREPNKGDPAQ